MSVSRMVVMAGGVALALSPGLLGCTVGEGTSGGFGGGFGSGGSSSTGDPAIEVVDLGSEDIDSSGETEVTVEVPAGAQSFALVVEGAGSELVVADKITSPSETVVFDFDADITTNRTDATDGLYTILVPTNPDVVMEEGDWTINLRTGGGSFESTLTGVIKTQPPTENTLDLKLYFVGVDGLDAATAESDTAFQEIMTNVGAIYADANLSIRSIAYQDITGGDADTYGVIDSIDGPSSELAGLFSLSPSESNRSVNLFFVEDIGGGGGFSILGLSGGVPGPPVLQGTTRSGVAISMANYVAANEAGDEAMLAEASAELEIIIGHETGHFLGLFHTTEKNGLGLDGSILGQDPLSDTPLCPDGNDGDGNNVLSPAECAGEDAGNLMFWSPANTSRALSSKQGSVMRTNPLVF